MALCRDLKLHDKLDGRAPSADGARTGDPSPRTAFDAGMEYTRYAGGGAVMEKRQFEAFVRERLQYGEPLVAGPWGDISPHFHQLILSFAESRVAALSRSQGWEAGPGQLGKVVGETRRALSVTIVRANALCLLERLSQLGPGAGAAAKRRQVAVRMEERRRQDRQAFDLAWQARGTSRVGRAFVQ